jgi:tetratricopeptide (TPR) repeat protein
VRNGFYGRPWVSAIDADVEIHSRAVLALVPGAAQVRKDLAWFQARSRRFADAAATTRDYARDFPEDKDFPLAMAKLLTTRDRFQDVVTVLADIVPRREDAEAYMLLGYALAMQGRQRADGLAYLERARALQPRNWWPHYALGWAYAAGGDYRRAVPAFEQAVALRHGLSDAERELQRLRPLAAGTPAR